MHVSIFLNNLYDMGGSFSSYHLTTQIFSLFVVDFSMATKQKHPAIQQYKSFNSDFDKSIMLQLEFIR